MVSAGTGEIVGTTTRNPRDFKIKANQSVDPALKDWVDKQYKTYYHLFYESLPKELSRAIKFRFMYLCTYLGSDYYLHGDVSGENLNKADLKTIMYLADKQFYETFNALIDAKVLKETPGGIRVNRNSAIRGNLQRHSGAFTRVFNETIRELYLKSEAVEHERMGILLDLLKFVHIQTNELCFNPLEANLDELQYMTRADVMKELHIGKNKLNEFRKVTINNGSEYLMITWGNPMDYKYVLNPRISYKGSSLTYLDKTWKLRYFTVRTPIILSKEA